MTIVQEKQYQKGYIAGYRDGARDMQMGRYRDPAGDQAALLPIDLLNVSTRARNCLRYGGCTRIEDVIKMDTLTILKIRGMGQKTIEEVAKALDEIDLCIGDWAEYLRE